MDLDGFCKPWTLHQKDPGEDDWIAEHIQDQYMRMTNER